MMTLNFTGGREGGRAGGREGEKAGFDLPLSRSHALTSGNFLLGRKFPGLVLEHHRDVVLDGIAEAAGPADELGLRLAIEQGPLAERADQDVEQLRVHVFKTSPVNADG